MSKNYIRLTISERKIIEENLNKGMSISKIAYILCRSKSTVAAEIDRNRIIARGTCRGKRPTTLPKTMCPKLCKSPFVCNNCRQISYACSKPIQIKYDAARADVLAKAR